MVDPELKKLPLMEIFGPTIQGEGIMIGAQTYFIRMGLCDYKCTMCDSMHAVDPDKVSKNAQWLTQAEILEAFTGYAHSHPQAQWITISGGNPAIHDLYRLTRDLKTLDFKLAVETQGSYYDGWLHQCDVITVSPKGPGMGERFEEDKFLDFMFLLRTNPGLNVKIVVFGKPDFDFAEHVLQLLQDNELISPDRFYLSQGNPFPPGQSSISTSSAHSLILHGRYLKLLKELQERPQLSIAKFLPQLHVWLWSNKQGV